MHYLYRAHLETDPDGGFLVTFPDVPEAITAGADRAGALAMASEALGLALRGYAQADRPLPVPTAGEGVPVPVGAQDALKLAVVSAFRESGITKTELAKRLGRREVEGRRILDPDHPTGLALLEQALAVLGKRVILEVEDAA